MADSLNLVNSRFCFISFSQLSLLYVDEIDSHSKTDASDFGKLFDTEIMPVFTRWLIPLKKSDSEI